jgi:hypothetical protein
MATIHHNTIIDEELLKEYLEKLEVAKNDDEKWELEQEYFNKIYKIVS